ncbi:MAG: nucleotidyltransferase domain-containing protein [Gemmatimonadota bacterium]
MLVETTPDPSFLVAEALRDVPGVKAAFVYGSTARGDHGPDSDIDLLVLEGPGLESRRLLGRLAEVTLLLGRSVNTIRYSERGLARRMGDPSHPAAAFVRGIITGPKRWVAGSPDPLLVLATAAGVPIPEEAVSVS